MRGRAAIALASAGRVSVLTKADASESNTGYAQGGIAAAFGDDAAVTMDEVAAVVGVTKPLLYAYFGNKERLYLACMEPAAEALVDDGGDRRARHSDARGGAAGGRARVLRLRRSRPQRVAGPVRRDAARRARSRRGGRRRSATG